MFDYTNPISYNTDINTIVFGYNTGATFGINPYTTGSFFDGSIFSPQNLFRNLIQGNFYKQPNLFMPDLTGVSFGSQSGIQQQFMMPAGDFNIYKMGQQTSSAPISTPQKTEEAKAQTAEKTEKSSTEKTSKNKKTESKKTNNKISNPNKMTLGEKVSQNALKYKGYNEADGSFKKFSNDGEWCADFIKYVLEETYREQGKKLPDGLKKEPDKPHLRVENIKQWGIKNNIYLTVAGKQNKAKLIAEKVKTGDIMILRENGASHTGFVTKVNNDGTFETVEGNRGDRVATAKYSPNYPEISGFVQLKS